MHRQYKKLTTVLMFWLLFSAVAVAAGSDNAFLSLKTKTFDKEKFMFPADFAAGSVNVVFLGMSTSQENGEYQQQLMLDWYAALQEQGAFSNAAMAYHFMALESPPFFVKGIIRNAMAEPYEGKLPMSQAGVLYVDDLQEFADAAGLALDQQPVIVLVTADGKLRETFKGEPAADNVAALKSAIDAYLPASSAIESEAPPE